MTTTTTSAALVPAGPVFSNPERLALAGFLAGYSGMTREAYALDLRQFTTWCHNHGLPLFGVRRADIECFGRDREAAGRALLRWPIAGAGDWSGDCAWHGLGLRWFPVPAGGDLGRGPLVPAVRAVLPGCRGAAGRARCHR